MSLSPNSAIALDETDWYYANWRNLPHLPRQSDDKFKLDTAVKLLIKRTGNVGSKTTPLKLDLKPAMPRLEAIFWNDVFNCILSGDPALVARYDNPDIAIYCSRIGTISTWDRLTVTSQIYAAQPLINFLKSTHASRTKMKHYDDRRIDFEGAASVFRRAIRPYLDPVTLQSYREVLNRELLDLQWPSEHTENPSPLFEIAASVGCYDAIGAIVDRFTPSQISHEWSRYGRPHFWLICGLPTLELFVQHKRRLDIGLTIAEEGRAWLAHTEADYLDDLSEVMIGPYGTMFTTWAETLGCVDTPDAAGRIVELMTSGMKRGTSDWLDKHPASAALGLAALCTQSGPKAEIAIGSLTRIVRLGKIAEIETALNTLTIEEAEAVRKKIGLTTESLAPIYDPFDDVTTPSWLSSALRQVPPVYLPWVSPGELPPIVIDGHMLNQEQVARLISTMTKLKADINPPLVESVKQHSDKTSLANFAWALFEAWANGGKSRERWIIYAVAGYADDKTAIKVGKVAFQAAVDKKWAIATHGLEILQTISTDSAIAEIYRFARKSSSGYIKEKAEECLKAAGVLRGLSPQELEDRTVPTCGLDSTGSRILDFGPRQFKVVLGQDAKPAVRSADGKIKSDPPKPNAADDPIKSAEAVDEWKVLKRQLATVVRSQVPRLEAACITERSWTRDEFESCFIRHPVMVNLVRMLVWAVFDPADPSGNYAATFRLTEDNTFTDANDKSLQLPNGRICLAHPARMASTQTKAWAQLLNDYEIVTPFQQTGRPVYSASPQEINETTIKRFCDVTAPATAVVFGLDKSGWEKIGPFGGGIIPGHLRSFPRDGVTAVIAYEPGVFIGDIAGDGDQTITSAFFVRSTLEEHLTTVEMPALTLHEIGPVTFSEVLYQLSLITKKAI